MDIKINIDNAGFLKDAEYSFYFHEFMKDYEDKFENLETINLLIEESFPNLRTETKEWFLLDEEKKTLTIIFSSQKYFIGKRRVPEYPSSQSIFQDLRVQMNIAVDRYKKSSN